ncbi:hypothetical protein Tdes44962_MAKER07221 [Teratosphaeria destructans]|uniref:Uncharacterized protein n=1 Tax=Teratosphaeria destructans TaxID=418781 RepID=A0A9W7SZV3_9PEZI|nr:hypothetical protein Tdes44962_MAKER07221 [Teratosphaeria destructans]
MWLEPGKPGHDTAARSCAWSAKISQMREGELNTPPMLTMMRKKDMDKARRIQRGNTRRACA